MVNLPRRPSNRRKKAFPFPSFSFHSFPRIRTYQGVAPGEGENSLFAIPFSPYSAQFSKSSFARTGSAKAPQTQIQPLKPWKHPGADSMISIVCGADFRAPLRPGTRPSAGPPTPRPACAAPADPFRTAALCRTASTEPTSSALLRQTDLRALIEQKRNNVKKSLVLSRRRRGVRSDALGLGSALERVKAAAGLGFPCGEEGVGSRPAATGRRSLGPRRRPGGSAKQETLVARRERARDTARLIALSPEPNQPPPQPRRHPREAGTQAQGQCRRRRGTMVKTGASPL